MNFAIHGAIITGCAVAAYAVSSVQKKKAYEEHFMKTAHFQKSLHLLKGYKAAADFLGEPIEAKGIDLQDPHSSVQDLHAKLSIYVAGPKEKGKLFTDCKRATKDDEWIVKKLEFKKISTGQQWTFYKSDSS